MSKTAAIERYFKKPFSSKNLMEFLAAMDGDYYVERFILVLPDGAKIDWKADKPKVSKKRKPASAVDTKGEK